MWCSKQSWKLAPHLFKHLVIWILVTIVHYCLFSLCWFLVIKPHPPSYCPLLFKYYMCAQRPPFSGLCIFRLVINKIANASVHNDFLIGPEVLAYDCFTPGLWLSVGDGSFSENWTVDKWPFLNLKLLLKSEGLDQKKRNIRLESRWQIWWEWRLTPKMASLKRKRFKSIEKICQKIPEKF